MITETSTVSIYVNGVMKLFVFYLLVYISIFSSIFVVLSICYKMMINRRRPIKRYNWLNRVYSNIVFTITVRIVWILHKLGKRTPYYEVGYYSIGFPKVYDENDLGFDNMILHNVRTYKELKKLVLDKLYKNNPYNTLKFVDIYRIEPFF